jgi:hypothetical protein
MATLALGMNDLTLVHEQIEVDEARLSRYFYWLRLAVAHFYEAAKYLDDTSQIADVRSFISGLTPGARESYQQCLDCYQNQETAMSRVRNEAAFHYPELNPARGNRPMQKVLRRMEVVTGVVEKGESGKSRDSRLRFADDVVAQLFQTAVGGKDAARAVHEDIKSGTAAFMKFANAALDQWLFDAQERGVKFFDFDGAQRAR